LRVLTSIGPLNFHSLAHGGISIYHDNRSFDKSKTYNSILRFDFLLTLQIILNAMNITLTLSRIHQTQTFDISETQTLIQSALTVLTNKHNENDLKDIFKKI